MKNRRLLFLLLIAALLLGAWRLLDGVSKKRLALPSSAPPLSATPFENTTAEAGYIGLQACADCHVEQYQSFLRTAHSNALAEVDPAKEPPDVEFEHALSGRSYRVYRADGVMRHREWLALAGLEPLVQDHPVKYLIGSGRHTRSYLVEDAGFYTESPLTWYESRKAWGMSPGFDRPQHMGFERAAGLGCVTCHVGRAEDAGLHSIVIREQAIGCETCHGPGSLHAERRHAELEKTNAQSDANDRTIVNPRRLSRELGEAICAQCHLRSNASILVRGRKLSDFRPGLPLTDFRVDYQLDKRNADEGRRPRGTIAAEPVLPGLRNVELHQLPRPAPRSQARGGADALSQRMPAVPCRVVVRARRGRACEEPVGR